MSARVDVARLGLKARAQIAAATTPKAKATRRTASSNVLLRCCTPGCTFPPTTNLTGMERHADSLGHHRYENVL